MYFLGYLNYRKCRLIMMKTDILDKLCNILKYRKSALGKEVRNKNYNGDLNFTKTLSNIYNPPRK